MMFKTQAWSLATWLVPDGGYGGENRGEKGSVRRPTSRHRRRCFPRLRTSRQPVRLFPPFDGGAF